MTTTSPLFSVLPTHLPACVGSSLYYGLGFLSGVISTVIIALVCVVTIAIIYHSALVKGEVCVCVTGAVLSDSCLTGKTSSTSATSVSAATEMISTNTNPSYGEVQYPTSTHKTTTPVYDDVVL